MKIKFDQVDNPFLIADNGFFSQWCCNCGMRHIWHFKMHKGFIEVSIMNDDKGTKLRKHYEKNN